MRDPFWREGGFIYIDKIFCHEERYSIVSID